MRDPADVIGFAVRFAAEEWATTPMHVHPVAPSFVARHVLAALRDEYGETYAEIKIESPAPDPNTVYVRTVQRRVVPVPAGRVEEGEA